MQFVCLYSNTLRQPFRLYILFRIHGNDDWMNFDNQQMMEAYETIQKASEFQKKKHALSKDPRAIQMYDLDMIDVTF